MERCKQKGCGSYAFNLHQKGIDQGCLCDVHYWQSRAETARLDAGEAPSIEAAHSMGASGGPVVEAERLAFEAWMRGHCWALTAAWDGVSYRGTAEHGNYICPHAMDVRMMWAAWRDRAALTANAK